MPLRQRQRRAGRQRDTVEKYDAQLANAMFRVYTWWELTSKRETRGRPLIVQELF